MIGVDTTFLIHFELSDLERHAGAEDAFRQAVADGEPLLLTPLAIAEFLHVVTDGRRFVNPLPMATAIERIAGWMSTPEVRIATASPAALRLANDWMLQHRLGRKRVLDTQLAATFWTHGVRRVLTLNGGDFTPLAPFEIVPF